MVFVTAGMGGGTGTGAAPVVARIAKEKGLLTIGIVTIPFIFEGPKKIQKAIDGAVEMSKNVDALLVINNERLNDIYGDLDFLNAFGKADDTLTTAARSISELITEEGYINLDFNRRALARDFRLNSYSGTAVIFKVKMRKRNGDDIHVAVKSAVKSEICKLRINTVTR
jgi:cell division GTPase FtsZ